MNAAEARLQAIFRFNANDPQDERMAYGVWDDAAAFFQSEIERLKTAEAKLREISDLHIIENNVCRECNLDVSDEDPPLCLTRAIIEEA